MPRRVTRPKAIWNAAVDADVSERAIEILNSMGITRSSAVNLFAHAIVRENGLPVNIAVMPAEALNKNRSRMTE